MSNPSGSVVKTVSVDGTEFNSTRAPSATGKVVRGATLAAAKTGTLTTRTDDNTGTLTMSSGHGITTGNKIHLYWVNTDGTRGFAHTVAGTVATNSVPIDTGAGDNLPPLNTAVTAMVPTSYDFVVEYANLVLLAFRCDQPAYAVVRQSGGTVEEAVEVTGSTGSYSWDSGDGTSNPLAADVTSVDVSHGDATASRAVKLVALVN
jgi:hypothetical protein